MSEPNGHNGNGRRSITQWGAVIISVVVALGSFIGAYASIQGELREHRSAIEALKNFQSDQRDYNKELRERIAKADEELRAGIRLLVIQLLDEKGKGKP